MVVLNSNGCFAPSTLSVPALSWLVVADVATGHLFQASSFANVTANAPSAPFALSTGDWSVRQVNGSGDWTRQRWVGQAADVATGRPFGLDVCVTIAPDSTQAMGQHGLCHFDRTSSYHLEQTQIKASGTVLAQGVAVPVSGALCT